MRLSAVVIVYVACLAAACAAAHRLGLPLAAARATPGEPSGAALFVPVALVGAGAAGMIVTVLSAVWRLRRPAPPGPAGRCPRCRYGLRATQPGCPVCRIRARLTTANDLPPADEIPTEPDTPAEPEIDLWALREARRGGGVRWESSSSTGWD